MRVKMTACRMLLTLLATGVLSAGSGIHREEADAHRGQQTGIRSHPFAITWGPLIPRDDPTITRRVYGYSPSWVDNRYLHYDLLTNIGLFDVTLEPDGRISNYSDFPGHWSDVIARAHRNGVKCELVATCFGWWNVHQAITVGADSAIRNLVELADSTGMDGINMDFEEILGADRDTMVRFMRRLSAACRGRGLTLTMATMPLDFQNAYDFAALADTTDGLFMMEYNFHWPGCPEAGPTAPLFGWDFYGNLQGSLAQYLGAIGNGRKLLFGMPYYGYDWPTLADTTHARTSGTGADLYYVNARPGAQMHGKRWDTEGRVPWYCYDSGGWRQGWYDDDSSLMLKYQEVYEHDLLGTGMWALGYDGARHELWSALRESFNRPLTQFTNGDCETWRLDTGVAPSDTSVNPAGWYEGRRAQYRRETAVTRSGIASIRHLTDNLGDTGRVVSLLLQDVAVSPGVSYELSGWARKSDGQGNRMKLVLEWYDAQHRVIARAGSEELSHDTTAWCFLTTDTQAAPGAAVFARLSLVIVGTAGFDHWDDISFAPATGIAETNIGPAGIVGSTTSVVRGVLEIGRQLTAHSSQPGIGLLDVSGRKVMALRPGPNDVSRLMSGVYFVRDPGSGGGGRGDARKVVILK